MYSIPHPSAGVPYAWRFHAPGDDREYFASVPWGALDLTPPVLYFSAAWAWLEYLTRGPDRAEEAMAESLRLVQERASLSTAISQESSRASGPGSEGFGGASSRIAPQKHGSVADLRRANALEMIRTMLRRRREPAWACLRTKRRQHHIFAPEQIPSAACSSATHAGSVHTHS